MHSRRSQRWSPWSPWTSRSAWRVRDRRSVTRNPLGVGISSRSRTTRLATGPVLLRFHAFMGSLEMLWEREEMPSIAEAFASFACVIRHAAGGGEPAH